MNVRIHTLWFRLQCLVFLWGFPLLMYAQDDEENRLLRSSVKLLVSFDGNDEVPIGPGISTWLSYFGPASKWAYNVGIGICVLWVLIGGIEIMISSDKQDVRQRGIDHMKWSIAGMVLLVFSGVVLRTLNSIVYV